MRSQTNFAHTLNPWRLGLCTNSGEGPQGVRRVEGGPGAAAEGVGAGEHEAEASEESWENGYFEIFYSMKEMRVLTERFRVHYNTVWPHSSFGYRPPASEAAW